MGGIACIVRRGIAVSALAAAGAALTACALAEQHYDLRYRLTLEIDTPEGLRSGSGVFQVTTVLNPAWAPGPQTDARLSGEAVAVELPNGERLFAVLHGGPGAYDLLNLSSMVFRPLVTRPEFRTGGSGRTYYDLAKQNRFLKSARPRVQLRGEHRPYLVRFRDIRDPLSVQAVDPDDLARIYGRGYRLRRATMQVTEERITRRIDEYLPWLDKMGDAAFDGSEYKWNNDPKSLVGKGYFKTAR